MLQNLVLRRLQYNRQTSRFFITIIALGFAFDGDGDRSANGDRIRVRQFLVFDGAVSGLE